MADTIVITVEKYKNIMTFTWWPGTSYANVKYPGDKFAQSDRPIENLEGFFFFIELILQDLIDRKEKDYVEEQIKSGKAEFKIGMNKKVERL